MIPIEGHDLCREISGRRTFRTEEFARDVNGLAADDNDLLAIEQLLRDRAGQAAAQVAFAVDYDLFPTMSAGGALGLSQQRLRTCWMRRLWTMCFEMEWTGGREGGERTTGSKLAILDEVC